MLTQRRDSVVVTPDDWKPNAERSVWMGVLFPGLGQIYNRSYWKLPVVYGGFMGCGFAIGMNQGKYDRYKQAYRDLYTARQQHGERVPETEDLSYMKVVPKGYTIERLGGASAYLETLNNWQTSYRRYRDISILATIVVYGLSIIDAYVDARLYDFDISPDLSMHAEPALYVDPFNNRAVEARIALTLK